LRKIVFDVDNVLADSTSCWCRKASDYLDKVISKEDIKNDKIVGSVSMPTSAIYRIQDEVWQEWQNLPMTEEGIPELISKIKKRNYKILIATCRPSRSTNLVQKWLESTGIDYDSFYSLGPYRSKAELDCDVLVDDSPNQISRMTEKGKTGFLYSQPWNASAKIPNAIKIKRLIEIPVYLPNAQ
jgi:5'(3')-deoxyribonucleotidase